MTDPTLHHAIRLLRRGVSAEETAALLGLLPRQIDFVRQTIEREDVEQDGDDPRLRDEYFGSVMEGIADGVRELFEYGCDVEEICERLAQLVDVVGENVIKERAGKKLPVMVSVANAGERFFPLAHSAFVDSPAAAANRKEQRLFFKKAFFTPKP